MMLVVEKRVRWNAVRLRRYWIMSLSLGLGRPDDGGSDAAPAKAAGRRRRLPMHSRPGLKRKPAASFQWRARGAGLNAALPGAVVLGGPTMRCPPNCCYAITSRVIFTIRVATWPP